MTPQGGGQVYRVPFAGFVGDYQGIQVLAPTAMASPLSGCATACYADRLSLTVDWSLRGTFTMAGNDIPFLLVHLEHQSRRLRVEVYSDAGKNWHRAYDEEYLPRNSTATGFFAFPFDGTTLAGNKMYAVPDGTYVAQALGAQGAGRRRQPGALGDLDLAEFVIDRP